MRVLDLLGRVRLGEASPRRRSRGTPASPGASSGDSTWPIRRAPPVVEGKVEREKGPPRRPGPRSAAGRARCSTRPLTRSGCSAASEQVVPARRTRTRRPPGLRLRVSSTARASSAVDPPVVGAHGRRGRSERPFPRRSKVTTRACRAKYGIWGFPGAGMDDLPGGKQQMVGSPVAVHLVEHPDAVPLQEALVVGIARPGLLPRAPGAPAHARRRLIPALRRDRPPRAVWSPSRPHLEHEVEGCLRGAAEPGEARPPR